MAVAVGRAPQLQEEETREEAETRLALRLSELLELASPAAHRLLSTLVRCHLDELVSVPFTQPTQPTPN